MGLNTYARSLPYFTLTARQKVAESDVAITMAKTVDILSAHIWTGYDQGSQFEAGCRVWLEPSVATWHARRDRMAQMPSDPEFMRRETEGQFMRINSPRRAIAYGASLMIGGVYLHKHNTGVPIVGSGTGTAYQNDFYQLQQLKDIKPLHASKGSVIVIDRDIFNIDPKKTFNAWDVEIVMIVNELAVQTILRRALRRVLCQIVQAILVRVIRAFGHREML